MFRSSVYGNICRTTAKFAKVTSLCLDPLFTATSAGQQPSSPRSLPCVYILCLRQHLQDNSQVRQGHFPVFTSSVYGNICRTTAKFATVISFVLRSCCLRQQLQRTRRGHRTKPLKSEDRCVKSGDTARALLY